MEISMKQLTIGLFIFSLSFGAFAQDKIKDKFKPKPAQFACLPFKVAFDSMKACQKFKGHPPKAKDCKCVKL
jgi:hypothetical protein